MPSHTLSTRPPTPAERQVIQRQIRPDVPSYGCIAIVFGVVPVVFLAMAGGWIARHVFPTREGLGWTLGALAGAGTFLGVLVTFILYERHRRRRALGDARDMLVQELA